MLTLTVSLAVIALSHAASIGTVSMARFTSLDQLNVDALWIHNQSSVRQCLCTVLLQFPTALLFNAFNNGSCQLFFALPFTYVMQYHSQSTLILLKALPPRQQAPCCSNLTWLVTRIANSAMTPVSLTMPTYLVIDDLDYLAVITYGSNLYRFNRTTMAQVTSKWIGPGCTALSYYNKQYFISCGTNGSPMVYVVSTRNLSSIKNISVPSGPRDVEFIRNGTVMILSMVSPDIIGFYNVTPSNTYTLTSTLSAPGAPYSLYRVNDTLLHVSIFSAYAPIYTLQTTSSTSAWTWGSFFAITNSSSTGNFQSTFDACGRMWVSARGYGIRIFDGTGSTFLYNWSRTAGLNGIVLTEKFDLYTAEFGTDHVSGYRPVIQQCTS